MRYDAVEIRLAEVEDSAKVVAMINELIVELGGGALPIQDAISTVVRLLQAELDGDVVVAVHNGEIVGVCTLSYQPSIRTLGRYGIIQEMYVVPEFRGAKLGRQIVEFAFGTAKDAGCETVELSTPPEGDRAENFYRNLGFEQAGVRMRYRV